MRTFFGEVAFGPSGPALALHGWNEDHNTLVLGFVFFRLYLHVPKWIIKHFDCERSYGFTFCDTGLHIHYGKTKVFWYPWSWDFYKRWEAVSGDSYARGQLFWVEVPRRMNYGQLATKNTASYAYTRKNGGVQNVTATYYVSRMEWRCRWLKWLPWPRKISTSIDVAFSDEVGEGSGSWKGGVLGCGYELLPEETPLGCLRRMERERKFSR